MPGKISEKDLKAVYGPKKDRAQNVRGPGVFNSVLMLLGIKSKISTPTLERSEGSRRLLEKDTAPLSGK